LQIPPAPQTTNTDRSGKPRDRRTWLAQSFSGDLPGELARLQERKRERPTGSCGDRSLGRRPAETRFEGPEFAGEASERGGDPWRPLPGV